MTVIGRALVLSQTRLKRITNVLGAAKLTKALLQAGVELPHYLRIVMTAAHSGVR
jgi:hypothetical protein